MVGDPFLTLLLAFLLAGLGVWLFWPMRGRAWHWLQRRHLTDKVLREDALKHIHTCEMSGRSPQIDGLAGTLSLTRNQAANLLADLEARGLIHSGSGRIRLTPQGRELALHMIRAHRLWERHLADETGYAEGEWHLRAERREHMLSPADADSLWKQLNFPTHDPHGDPIPTAGGDLPPVEPGPLTALPIDTPFRIMHLEDEPPVVYDQLVAEGLHPGMAGHLLDVSSRRVRFWAGGQEHVLAPIFAANIGVLPWSAEAVSADQEGERLSSVEPGETAEIVGLSPGCRGQERRRLLDLGFLPGTRITTELSSPSGDPMAYRVRGALLALRLEQAALIQVRRPEGDTNNGTLAP